MCVLYCRPAEDRPYAQAVGEVIRGKCLNVWPSALVMKWHSSHISQNHNCAPQSQCQHTVGAHWRARTYTRSPPQSPAGSPCWPLVHGPFDILFWLNYSKMSDQGLEYQATLSVRYSCIYKVFLWILKMSLYSVVHIHFSLSTMNKQLSITPNGMVGKLFFYKMITQPLTLLRAV